MDSERDVTNNHASAADAGAGADEGIDMSIAPGEAKHNELDEEEKQHAEKALEEENERNNKERTDAVNFWADHHTTLEILRDKFFRNRVDLAREFVARAEAIPYLTEEKLQIVSDLKGTIERMASLMTPLPQGAPLQLDSLSEEDQQLCLSVPLEAREQMIRKFLQQDQKLLQQENAFNAWG